MPLISVQVPYLLIMKKTLNETLTEAYTNAYNQIAKRQSARYGNPFGEATPSDSVRALSELVASNDIDIAQAKKIVRTLGRKQYGEWGHTYGVVSMCFERVLPHPVSRRVADTILTAVAR